MLAYDLFHSGFALILKRTAPSCLVHCFELWTTSCWRPRMGLARSHWRKAFVFHPPLAAFVQEVSRRF